LRTNVSDFALENQFCARDQLIEIGRDDRRPAELRVYGKEEQK
jgi:hypothetical protein